MNTIRTLLLRDFRRLLPHALIMLAILLAYFFYLPRSGHFTNSWEMRALFFLLPAALFATWLFVMSLMIHDAPPAGTTEFWMTRPISGAQLFAGKFIILAVYFALMPSLALIAGATFGLIKPDTVTLATFISAFSNFLLLALCMMLLASLTRNSTQFVFTIIVIIFCFILFMVLAADILRSPEIFRQNPKLFIWVLKGVSIAGLTAIIHTQYVRRRRVVTATASALLALLLLGIWQLWPTIPKP